MGRRWEDDDDDDDDDADDADADADDDDDEEGYAFLAMSPEAVRAATPQDGRSRQLRDQRRRRRQRYEGATAAAAPAAAAGRAPVQRRDRVAVKAVFCGRTREQSERQDWQRGRAGQDGRSG